ncbi:hypothetical protein KL933_000570 [Ogataea haglerorum]|uniref:Uncharacterized protein n=1 Tax=Ogataea haglerorum TaxID=1937702 RepID=A0AAN6I2P2_9ASCO|nr:uncharacterized protein KL911_003451 [Ogataea haglerorum]KAG7700081.1 hypothetical protein KL915_000770 [Ogataea haglerorum]KAG7701739.1 hypothetical protein KL951_000195 [Ogataea haglerorum]KAG7722376.1 hypothetical protein KL913_000196 [Ogataea haglerorum]KAG7723520.1 hypothetical protein KL949_000570 [Ogataea haglerorum]KAG7730775.1 hypothetical protein KL933_000570 [Ogataea haglerorum]
MNLSRRIFSAQRRFASSLTAINELQQAKMLARVQKFDDKTKIFDKLDNLHMLVLRKGYYNVNINKLGFQSNSPEIRDRYSNLYHIFDIEEALSQHFTKMPLLSAPQPTTTFTGSGSSLMVVLNSMRQRKDSPVENHIKLLHRLARNDVELKRGIQDVLKTFEKEDDFFYQYVLDLWEKKKEFSRMVAKQRQAKEAAQVKS